MAAAMNGIALNGGFIPYGGTFLVFSDYCRPSIRLAALMRQRVIYVMTHDSIGLGEDGPTHQPIEQLAALRAIPHLLVLRPADGVETAECWEIALQHDQEPIDPRAVAPGRAQPAQSADVRQPMRQGRLRAERARGRPRRDADRHRFGGRPRRRGRARARQDRACAPPSCRCRPWSCSARRARPTAAGPRGAPRVAIEAGIAQCWYEWLGANGRFVGLSDFGASAPAPKLYEHFGLTADKVVATVRALLAR